ncbi:MAG: substrate-binding domain-containing protein [Vicinamibacterales bacterium]
MARNRLVVALLLTGLTAAVTGCGGNKSDSKGTTSASATSASSATSSAASASATSSSAASSAPASSSAAATSSSAPDDKKCVTPTGTGFSGKLTGPNGEPGVTADTVKVTDEDKAAASAAVKGKTVAISQHFSSDYTSQVSDGIANAMKALGANIITSDAGGKPEKQVSDIESLLAKKPALLVVFPVDAAASTPGIKAANAAKVPVVIVGSALKGAEFESLISADNYEGGVIAAKQMIDALGNSGDVAILPYKFSLWHVDERVAGFRDGIACSGLKVVADKQTCQAVADCTGVFADVLTANPNLKGGFGAYDGIALGMNAAAKTAGKDVFITTSDLGGDSAKAIASGSQPLKATAAQLTDAQASVTAAISTLVLAGKPVPKMVFAPDAAVSKDNVAQLYEKLFGKPLS